MLASNITLNYPGESKSDQGRRRWRQLFEGASTNLSILLLAADLWPKHYRVIRQLGSYILLKSKPKFLHSIDSLYLKGNFQFDVNII